MSSPESTAFAHLKAVVFDWAGTVIDHGCLAPAIVFQEIFAQRGITVTPDQAREPMGMAKRAHIAAVAAMPEVADSWLQVHGAQCQESDIDAMYADFLPLQQRTLHAHSRMIEGAVEMVGWCRDHGLKIGSSTGYTRELMEVVTESARQQGYVPDCVLCAEDAPEGRPAPWLLFEAAKRMNVYPMWNIVKVDDTPVGIQAGRNAGCWTVGVTRTGNGVGLSVEEASALPPEQLARRCNTAEAKLRTAGAHYIVETVADLQPVLVDIENRLEQGHHPL